MQKPRGKPRGFFVLAPAGVIFGRTQRRARREPSISTYQVIVVLLGALAGGFVNGLTGFGTGLTVMGIWLYAISPTVAATLVIISSVVTQLQTLPMIWHAIESGEARGLTPFNPFYGYRGLLMLRPEEIL
jgi:hypothetical protein